MDKPKIVLLGGGTGSFTLLQGLKKLTPHITAVVNMSDDGGSTGSLRDEYGVLPPGDARQCLVALSDSPEVRRLFAYRFTGGPIAGHSVGNLILSALEMEYGNFAKALQVAGDILHITGRVVPVTLDKHTLIAENKRKVYRGEHVIDGQVRLSKDAQLRLEPRAVLNPDAKRALLGADMVVFAPGSLHTSLIPILLVDGMTEALAATQASVASVTNLVNKPLQTDGWHVVDYIKQLERYAGPGHIDVVLYNDEPITAKLLKRYAADGEYPVHTEPDRFKETTVSTHSARLVSKELSAHHQGGELHRTLIRHDADQVWAELFKLLRN